MPASIFDLPLDALCQRLDYLSDWFVAEHVALVDDAPTCDAYRLVRGSQK